MANGQRLLLNYHDVCFKEYTPPPQLAPRRLSIVLFGASPAGCNSITCVCGTNFDWSQLIHQRNVRSTELFRIAHPDDPARTAVDIFRRGGPAAIVDRGDAVNDESANDDDDECEAETEAEEVRHLVFYSCDARKHTEFRSIVYPFVSPIRKHRGW